ncbi:MAG: hypothetical protein WCJ25_03505 [Candidatus Moraniibacteriota bacterium]
MMWLSNPAFDLESSLFLLGVSFVISIIVLAVSRKWFRALLVFSILGNLSFLVNIGSMMFDFYSIRWLGIFSLYIWPFVNIYLLLYRKDYETR